MMNTYEDICSFPFQIGKFFFGKYHSIEGESNLPKLDSDSNCQFFLCQKPNGAMNIGFHLIFFCPTGSSCIQLVFKVWI